MKSIMIFLSALAIFFMVADLGEAQTSFDLFEAIHDGHVGGWNSNVVIWKYYGNGTRIPYTIDTPCGKLDPGAIVPKRNSGRLFWGPLGTDTHAFTITYDPNSREIAFKVMDNKLFRGFSAESPIVERQTFCSETHEEFNGGLVGNVNNLSMVIRASAGNAVESCGPYSGGCGLQPVWSSKTEVSNLFLNGAPIEGFHVEANLHEKPEVDEFTNEARINLAVPDDRPWELTGDLTVTFEAVNMASAPGNWRVGMTAYGQFLETTDADMDGVADDVDECPGSVMNETISIGDCDSGVQNIRFENGCTVSDIVLLCATAAANHGGFISCVSAMSDFLKEAAVISGREKGNIQRCAARADIP